METRGTAGINFPGNAYLKAHRDRFRDHTSQTKEYFNVTPRWNRKGRFSKTDRGTIEFKSVLTFNEILEENMHMVNPPL